MTRFPVVAIDESPTATVESPPRIRGKPSPGEANRGARNARFALAAFVVVEIAAFGTFFILGRRLWFRWDDWDFLANRTAWDLGGLLTPHIDHWSTVPILTYRALWQIFGLRFVPYLVTALGLHLISAALLRVVMRRAGVGPWVATAAASLFALFGAGFENTAYLMNLNFGGWPIVFGLSYLILVDHDGPFDHRDWIGLAAGVGALASSGLGVPMVAAVGAATLLRRGPRVALAHMLTLIAIYTVWYLSYAPDERGASAREILTFVLNGTRATFFELGQSNAAAIGLAILPVVGLLLAWRSLPREKLRRRASLPLGLLFGALVFFIVTGYARGDAPGEGVWSSMTRSHYVAAAAIMLLPALAVGAQALADRVHVLAPVVPLIFLIGIPGNIAAFEDAVDSQEPLMEGHERIMLTLPRTPRAAKAPRDLAPEPLLAPRVTVGWLLEGLAAGRLPAPPKNRPPSFDGELEVRTSIQQTNGRRDVTPCNSLRGPVLREFGMGQRVSLARGFVEIALLRESGWTVPVKFGEPFADPSFGQRGETLTAVRGPLTVRIAPVGTGENILCG
jgi:hypothetical protein